MMELLGYGREHRKRKRNEEESEGRREEERRARKKDRTRSTGGKDLALDFVLDAIAATKSDRRAEPPNKTKKKEKT